MRRFSILLFLFVCLVHTNVAAQESGLTAAVLGLTSSTFESAQLETYSSIVRNEARQLDKYDVVNKIPVNFNDVKNTLGCDGASTDCLKQTAELLKARFLVYGSLNKLADGSRIELFIFDGRTGKTINTLKRTIPSTEDLVVGFQRETAKFFAGEKEIALTRIQIGSNVSGAKVYLEDTFVGKVPLERKGLPPGSYKIIVTKDGFSNWESRLELIEGTDVQLWAKLDPQSADPVVNQQLKPKETGGEVRQIDSPRNNVNWGSIAVIGLGVVALGASVTFGALFKNVESTIDDERRNGTLTERRYVELRDRGESQALAHYALLGVGAAGVGVGVLWFILDDGGESETVQLNVGHNHVSATIHW